MWEWTYSVLPYDSCDQGDGRITILGYLILVAFKGPGRLTHCRGDLGYVISHEGGTPSLV